MTRTLTFGADDGKRFDLLLTGFVTGGNQLNQGSRPRKDRKREATILRALKAISEPLVAGAGQVPDESRRALHDDGGTVVLEQDQHALLVKYVEACPFFTHVSDDVDELLDWLHAAPKGNAGG